MVGSIRIPAEIGQVVVELTLICTRRRMIQSGAKTTYNYSEMLKLEAKAPASPGGMNTSTVEVAFEIPKDAYPSLDQGFNSDDYFWKLTARAEIPGADFWAKFDLTVSGPVEQGA